MLPNIFHKIVIKLVTWLLSKNKILSDILPLVSGEHCTGSHIAVVQSQHVIAHYYPCVMIRSLRFSFPTMSSVFSLARCSKATIAKGALKFSANFEGSRDGSAAYISLKVTGLSTRSLSLFFVS